MKITQEHIDRFAQGWQRADEEGTHVPGARRRAGLEEALRDVPDVEDLMLFARAAARHVTTDGVDEWNDMVDAWDRLPGDLRAQLGERQA